MNSVNCIKCPILCTISCESFIDTPRLDTKLLNFKIQKSGQILCAHKPYFLMPGNILSCEKDNTAKGIVEYCVCFATLILRTH